MCNYLISVHAYIDTTVMIITVLLCINIALLLLAFLVFLYFY